MALIYRKLQNLGGSLYVNLPKTWVNKYELKEKSPIALEIQSDGAIRILPKIKTQKEPTNEEVILQSSNYVVWELLKKCLSGATNIVIISDREINKSLKNDIKYFVSGLPNTEIIEETKNRVVVQNFGYKKIPTKKLIQRLLYLTADMFDDLKTNSLEDLNDNFEQLRKFYFILVIHIRTYLRTGIYVSEDTDFTPLEAMDYRMFCEKIKEISEFLKLIRLNENVMEFFNEIQKYFDEVMKAFLDKNDELAYFAWLKKDRLLEKSSIILGSLEHDHQDQIKIMLRITQNCKDMAALI